MNAMADTFSSNRLMMNRLRQLMAEGGEAQERLNGTVRLIANTMVADVCSIYLRTAKNELELVATEGLKKSATGRTRMRMDEGLVGRIAQSAEPLAIQDAPRHPDFSYRPETGEDPFHAFLGVPILRGGRVSGVLVVQNRTERLYGEDEVESLETIAMVLAEVVAADSIGSILDERPTRRATMAGRILSEGLAMGPVRLHDPVVPAAKFFASDPEKELRRLDVALEALRTAVDQMLAAETGGALLGEPRDVLETYRLLANDPSWAERLRDGVRGGLSAEASIDRTRREHRARLESARDMYLRERLHDLEDLDNRLLRILGGTTGNQYADGSKGAILVARRLGPAELLEYRNAGLAAIALEESSATSHAAIVARALGIPAIGSLESLTTDIETGDKIIIDAEEGIVHLRPEHAVREAYKTRMTLRKQRQAAFKRLRKSPARTKDGVDVSLMLNAGLRLDLDNLEVTGAEGVGLFRTEFQFLVSERIPQLQEQISFYKRVYDTAESRPVVFRTLDFGADKILPSVSQVREENPALGLRSLRFALDHKGVFRRQMRALIRAADGRPLSVMFPMVTTAAEFFEAKALLHRELAWNRKRGHAMPEALQVGAMLEVPAFAYALEEVADEVDFISIGTNDLMQFFFAADRMTPSISDRYDILSRPAIKMLTLVQDTCRRLGIEASVCGASAGSPIEALALVAIGFRKLSMPAGGIGPVKRMIRSLKLEPFRKDFQNIIINKNSSFRNDLLALAREHHVLLGNG